MTSLYQYDDMGALSVLGLSKKDLIQTLEEKSEKIEAFSGALRANMFPGFSIAKETDDLEELQDLVEDIHENFEHAVFLGVGGSSLGAQMLVSFAGKYKKHATEMYFLDNVDPHTVEGLVSTLPLSKTIVIAVSKSGGTIETMSETLLFAEAFSSENLPLSKHILGITEDSDSPLKRFLNEYEIPTLDHDDQVGGRFTILTLVGLLPALMAGLDVHALRQGAAEVLDDFYENLCTSPPALGAALAINMQEKGKSIQYMMPYSDRLAKLGDWFVQLWAESLGKEGKGTTPISALGSTDQHSALQMLMDGAKDKTVSLILPFQNKNGKKVSDAYAKLIDQPHLSGLTMGKLIYNQAHGTADALNANNVPVRLFYTEELNEKVLGALLMHLMLETAVGGILLDVNTWDQPGVEESKKRTLEYLLRNKKT